MMRRLSILFTLLCTLSACQQHRLGVDTRYIDRNSLASYWVGTPDPKKYCPTTGQELVVWWRLPEVYVCENMHLRFTLRFCDREEETVCWPIHHFCGCYTYRIVDEKYWAHCGIQTYKVEVLKNGNVIERWEHPIWAEWITFPDHCDLCGGYADE